MKPIIVSPIGIKLPLSPPNNAKSQIARSLEENVWPLLEQKKLVPVIDSVFDLADVSKAHRRMESSAHIGKIMLKVWD